MPIQPVHSEFYGSSASRLAFLTQILDPRIWRPALEDERGVLISRERPLAVDFYSWDEDVLEEIIEAVTVAAAAVNVVTSDLSVSGVARSGGGQLRWPPTPPAVSTDTGEIPIVG